MSDLPKGFSFLLRQLRLAGASEGDFVSTPPDILGPWLLPPITGEAVLPAGRKLMTLVAYAPTAVSQGLTADSIISAYQAYINYPRAAGHLLAHFEGTRHPKQFGAAKIYLLPSRHLNDGAACAVGLARMMHELVGGTLHSFGNTYCVRLGGYTLGLVDGLPYGSTQKKWTRVEAAAVDDYFACPRSVPLDGLNPNAVRLRNLLEGFRNKMPEGALCDQVASFLAVVHRRSRWTDARHPGAEWDAEIDQQEVAIASLLSERLVVKDDRADRIQRQADRVRSLGEALEGMHADLPEAHKLNLLRAMLVPEALSNAKFKKMVTTKRGEAGLALAGTNMQRSAAGLRAELDRAKSKLLEMQNDMRE